MVVGYGPGKAGYRLQVSSRRMRGSTSERRGNNSRVSRILTSKPRQESGLDCLACALFAGYRKATGPAVNVRVLLFM